MKILRGVLIGSLVLFLMMGMLGCEEEADVQEWPEDPVTIVVPFGEGGTNDRVARALAPHLEDELGVPVTVENREGGAGIVGKTTHLHEDPADGSYFVYTLQPYLSGAIFREGEFEVDDFAYLSTSYSSPQGVWVQEDSDYDSLVDLLTEIQDNPDDYSYAYLGGSFTQVGAEVLLEAIDSEATAVPFDSAADQRTALMGGEVDFIVSDLFGTMGAVGDELRLIGIFDDEGHPNVPDVSSVNDELAEMDIDADLPDLDNFHFQMVNREFKENYPERFDVLTEALEAALQNEELIEWFEDQDMEAYWEDPDATRQMIEESHEASEDYSEFWED